MEGREGTNKVLTPRSHRRPDTYSAPLVPMESSNQHCYLYQKACCVKMNRLDNKEEEASECHLLHLPSIDGRAGKGHRDWSIL